MGLMAKENMDGKQAQLKALSNCLISSPVPKPLDEDSSSEWSDEVDDLECVYAGLPEDLSFTLLGLDFALRDFKTMADLGLNLDVLMTLSESELAEIGLLENQQLKQHIVKNSQSNNNLNIPRRPVKLTRKDIQVLSSGMMSHLSEMILLITNVKTDLNLKKPVNYREFEGCSSLELLRLACKCIVKQARKTQGCVNSLSAKVGFKELEATRARTKRLAKIRQKMIVRKVLFCAFGSLGIYLAVKYLWPTLYRNPKLSS